jgi:hypothetical protein
MHSERRKFDLRPLFGRPRQQPRIPPTGSLKRAATGESNGEMTIVAIGGEGQRVFNLDLQSSHSKPPTRRCALRESSE